MTPKSSSSKIHSRLSRIRFITSTGDFISTLYLVFLITHITGDASSAGLIVSFKALGSLGGGLLWQKFFNAFSLRKTLAITQFFSGVFTLVLVLLAVTHTISTTSIYILTAVVSFFGRVFEVASEEYSKNLPSDHTHLSTQAVLMSGLFSAQMIGPLIAFGLIRMFSSFSIASVSGGVVIPLVIDATSFILAGALALRLPDVHATGTFSLLAPFSYLGKSRLLLHVFLIRGVGLWVHISLFNFFLFAVMMEHYGLGAETSGFVYSLVALGSLIASQSIQAIDRRSNPDTYWKRTFAFLLLGTVALVFSRSMFVSLSSFGMAAVWIVIGGFGNGANAVGTRALLRKAIDEVPDAIYAEVLAIDLTVGKVVEFGLGVLVAILVGQNYLTYSTGMLLSSLFAALLLVWFTILGFLGARTTSRQ